MSRGDKMSFEAKLDPALRTLQAIAISAGGTGGDYKLQDTEIVPSTKPQ